MRAGPSPSPCGPWQRFALFDDSIEEDFLVDLSTSLLTQLAQGFPIFPNGNRRIAEVSIARFDPMPIRPLDKEAAYVTWIKFYG
ncbi:MAG TPA: hypothetical protein VEK34_04575 [Methylocella sp.]|nr:hypothetical protein [Methylocella sp.]